LLNHYKKTWHHFLEEEKIGKILILNTTGVEDLHMEVLFGEKLSLHYLERLIFYYGSRPSYSFQKYKIW